MRILLHYWIRSLYFFSPTSLKTMLIRSLWTFGSALTLLVKNFYWIIAAEFLAFAILSDLLKKQQQADLTQSADISMLVFLSILLAVLSTIISTAFLLFMRKDEPFTPPMQYFKHYFFRYLQFSLLIFLGAFIGLLFVAGFGITKLPSIHHSIVIIIKALNLLAVLFWLDGTSSIKNIFLAFERAINLFFYNLPLFIALLFGLFFLEYSASWLVFGKNSQALSTTIGLSQRIDLSSLINEQIPITSLIAFKYIAFIFEFFWTSIVICVYRQRRKTEYAQSLFTRNQKNEQD